MPRGTRLDLATITKVKAMLVQEIPPREIVQTVDVSFGAISNIRRGVTGAHVPWPNGACGAFDEAYPLRRNDMMHAAATSKDDDTAWDADARRYMQWKEQYRRRILEVVNEHRQATGERLIPKIDPTYEAYLNSPAADSPAEDAERRQHALEAENRRRATVIREFDFIRWKVNEENNPHHGLAGALGVGYDESKRPPQRGAPERPPFDPDDNPYLTPEELLRVDPRNPRCRKAVVEGDAVRLYAALIVYKLLPPTQWDIEQPVLDTMEAIKASPRGPAKAQEVLEEFNKLLAR